MLDIDTAIKHCLEVAEQNETQADKIGRQLIGSAMDKRATDCRECAADHRQLAEWLTELKEAKRLLKAAVEGFDNCADRCICDYCDSRCPFYNFGCVSGWKHRDEALALIGKEGEENG